MQHGEKIFERLVVKLSIVVGDNSMEKPESTDDYFPKECLDLALSDMRQGFCHHSFGELVNSNE